MNVQMPSDLQPVATILGPIRMPFRWFFGMLARAVRCVFHITMVAFTKINRLQKIDTIMML